MIEWGNDAGQLIVKLVRNLVRPEIRDRRELVRYVAEVTLTCMAVAVAIDVVNQLTFFQDWERTIRSWFITAAVAALIALPVSRAIARAHLELYRAKVSFEAMSRTDPLTGLLNRRALFEAAEGPLPAAMALVIVDIDRFKRINDTYGHIAGDAVIATVARAMAARFGDCGSVGRLGGEEFALICTAGSAESLAEKFWDFRDHVAGLSIVAGGASVSVTISAGIARRREGQSFAELYAEADRALYLAKAGGRNRVVLADEASTAASPATLPERDHRPSLTGDIRAETDESRGAA